MDKLTGYEDVLLTTAHHHLGELLFHVRLGKAVRIWNGTSNRVVAVLMPPQAVPQMVAGAKAPNKQEEEKQE